MTKNKQNTKKANHSVVQSLCWDNLAFSSALFCCVYSMNPAPKHSCMDWRLLFPCPCLKARVSFFQSRVCRARQRCRNWTETGAGEVRGCLWLLQVWQKDEPVGLQRSVLSAAPGKLPGLFVHEASCSHNNRQSGKPVRPASRKSASCLASIKVAGAGT